MPVARTPVARQRAEQAQLDPTGTPVITAATLIGVLVVAISLIVVRLARVPSGLVKTGGYGGDLWSALTGIYAAGLSFAVLPLVAASIVAAVAVVAVAVRAGQRWRIAVAIASAVVAIGVTGTVLGPVVTLAAAGVGGVAALVAARRAVQRLEADPASNERLPDILVAGATRRLWLLDAGLATMAIVALPAEETGALLMFAAVCGAATFAVLVRPTREQPGAPAALSVWIGLAAAVVPAGLVVSDLADTDGVHSALWWGAVATAVAVPVVVRVVFREAFGPFHEPAPRSPRPHGPEIIWAWVGGVRDDSACIVVRPRRRKTADQLSLHLEPGGIDLVPTSTANGVVRFDATRLRTDTRYAVSLVLGGETVGRVWFRTFGPASRTIRIAAGSCASTGSNGSVFDTIAALGPDVFCHLGDLHYENIGRDHDGRFRRAYDDALSSPAVARMTSRVPIAYVFDDHDYGRNDSDREARSRPAAWRVYQERVPHYELGARDDPAHREADQRPVYQRFRIGPVLVVLTDTRSEREPVRPTDPHFGAPHPRQLISDHQERWLTASAEEAARHGCEVLVWCSSTPWLGPDGADDDTWCGFPEQRSRIAEALLEGEREHGVTTVVVCGDAHMVGLDRGRADRARVPPSIADDDAAAPTVTGEHWEARVFPTMNAAALDRRGSRKGGRYGHYERPGAGQFGLVEVDLDADGRAARIRLVVHDVKGRLEYLTLPLTEDD